MLKELQNIGYFPTTGAEIVTNILVALFCGLFIAWLYRHTYKGPGYSITFINSMVVLTMITAVVILIIGNNLARAFGLVGAMSIIRFRTAVKETQDIVYIFFSLTAGMAAGVGYHKVALIGTLFIGLLIYLFSKSRMASPRKEEFLLQFAYRSNGEESPAYLNVLRRHCRDYKVINTRSLGSDRNTLELSYYVKFLDKERNREFMQELQKTEGVNQINLYFDEEQF
jgi:uncharacterized membrane protein YhiD involved in acid resistance